MCAGLLTLDKAPGDPVKGSIMHQKNNEKMNQEIKDKNTSRRLTEKREEEIKKQIARELNK